jgi:hypothetical protein
MHKKTKKIYKEIKKIHKKTKKVKQIKIMINKNLSFQKINLFLKILQTLKVCLLKIKYSLMKMKTKVN